MAFPSPFFLRRIILSFFPKPLLNSHE